MSTETNTNGVNKAITYAILSEEEMRKIGFRDCHGSWYFSKQIQLPKEKQYKNFEISFSVSIPKNGGELRIDVLDEDWGQPYDYQRMLSDNPNFKTCLIVKEQVEKWMSYLQEKMVLQGHVYGEYI